MGCRVTGEVESIGRHSIGFTCDPGDCESLAAVKTLIDIMRVLKAGFESSNVFVYVEKDVFEGQSAEYYVTRISFEEAGKTTPTIRAEIVYEKSRHIIPLCKGHVEYIPGNATVPRNALKALGTILQLLLKSGSDGASKVTIRIEASDGRVVVDLDANGRIVGFEYEKGDDFLSVNIAARKASAAIHFIRNDDEWLPRIAGEITRSEQVVALLTRLTGIWRTRDREHLIETVCNGNAISIVLSNDELYGNTIVEANVKGKMGTNITQVLKCIAGSMMERTAMLLPEIAAQLI